MRDTVTRTRPPSFALRATADKPGSLFHLPAPRLGYAGRMGEG